MAYLPTERLGYLEPAFSNCGVDYFGPSLSLFGAARRKDVPVYVSHHPINTPGSSEFYGHQCVSAKNERLIARRGLPKVSWSDNRTKGRKTLLEVTRCCNDYAPAALVCKGIRWKFIPPSTPHHGGKRMVRSCKSVFYSILGNRRMTDETLSTTFGLVEQALDNRPLTFSRSL